MADARGRVVRQLDPVKLYLLNEPSVIPPEVLRTIADEVLPGARRQRLLQLLSLVAAVVLIVGGNIVYFGLFSTWKGLDPVLATIYVVQAVLVFGGPVLAFRAARQKYARRIGEVLLAHRRCPCCGYDLRQLPPDPRDGATVCPECGAAWPLP